MKVLGYWVAVLLWAALLIAAALGLSIYAVYLTAVLLMKTGGLY